MEEPGLKGSFRASVMWLTVLLVRCEMDIQKIFEFLMTTRILGKLDELQFESIERLILNYGDHKAPEKQPAGPLEEIPTCGFWLPGHCEKTQKEFRCSAFLEQKEKV